ncbi:MAG TPA: 50S ribosomal protein L9 [Clostridia bacterium]|nr:50S ribosomal protein L9 [Clostridia bacterium]
MKVILLEDVKGSGVKGDVVNVNDGHGRNYLIPRGLAMEANTSNLTELKNRERAEQKRKQAAADQARKMADKLSRVNIIIKTKSGENGKLFGSVTNKEIASELKKQHNLNVDRKKIVLQEPIKQLGELVLDVKLYPEITGKLKVKIEEA